MTLSQRAIGLIGGYSPVLLWWRAKRPGWAWRLHSSFGKPTTRYVRQNGLSVRRGGFEALEFPAGAVGHTNYLAAKLAGVYEPDVVSFLVEHVSGKKTFVDLGSGDGFFLSGLGRLHPELKLIGYEVNRYERALAQEIARTNGVETELRSLADESELRNLPDDGLLLLCDLEGLEEDLLDPARSPALLNATMVVEAHSQFRPDVVPLLTARFEKTHEVKYIPSVETDPGSLAELKDWPEDQAEIAVYDGHLPTEGWLTFVPRDPRRGR